MNNLKQLFSNRAVVFGLGIVILVIILAIFASDDARQAQELKSLPSPSPRFTFSDLNEDKRRQAIEYKKLIGDRLPIRTDFQTSAGINTRINIYFAEGDPAESTRFEIFGLVYMNQESDPNKNPNAKAFIESYQESLRLLQSKGIDPKQLIFVYPDQSYIRSTISKWLKDNKLSF